MARRALLARARAAAAARRGGAPEDRPVDREEHRAAAQLRRRAAALRAALPRGRCRPYRPAYRRQGPQPRRERRALPLRSLDLVLQGRTEGARRVLAPRARSGMEGRALLVV